MKRMIVRTAAAALAGVMAAGLLAGCGQKKLDGTKTVATVDGEEIPLGLLSLTARQQQAQLEAMYQSFMGTDYKIWSQPAMEDSEKTYGEQMTEEVLKQLEIMYLMRAKAADYGVELTEEDKTAIDAAAKEFMEANSEETIEELAVTEEQVQVFLELETYSQRVEDKLIEEADIEVTDEEAQQSGFTYISISTSGDELTEEDIAAKKEQAQEILDDVKKDPAGDMDEIAKAADETYSALEGTFTTNETEDEDLNSSSYPEEVIEALRGLKEGEVAQELIETDNGFYIVRLDSVKDEEATNSKKESVKSSREYDYFSEVTEGWLADADVKTEDKVLETLAITDDHSFTIQQNTEEEDALAEEEMESAEDIEDSGMEDAEVLEDTELSGDMDEAQTLDEEMPQDLEEEELVDGDAEEIGEDFDTVEEADSDELNTEAQNTTAE